MGLPVFRCKTRRSSAWAEGPKLQHMGFASIDIAGASAVSMPILLGKPHRSREIIITAGIKNGASTSRSITAASISGLFAGSLQTGATIGGTRLQAIIFPAPDKLQHGFLNMTFSGSVADYVIASVFRVVGRAKYGEGETDSDTASSAFSASINLNACTINPGGFMLGMGGHTNSNVNSVSGADVAAGNLAGAGTTDQFASWWRRIEPVSVTPSVTLSWSGSSGAIAGAWSFNP